MIKTIVFDIGNVLVKFDWKPYIYETFEQTTADAVANAVWGTGYWEEFDRGVLSDEEILKLMEKAAPEYKKEIHQAFEHAGKYLNQFSYAKPWIRELKEQGYRILYLSNYGETLMKMRPDVLDFIPLMDGGIFSCFVKRIKPDPKIYKILCDTYELDPKECLFIDDNRANIDAAKDFGLRTVLFEGYEKSFEIIKSRLAEHQ